MKSANVIKCPAIIPSPSDTLKEKVMNSKQKKILKIVIGVIFFMLIFPPYHAIENSRYKGQIVHNLGYGFILSPPQTLTSDGARMYIDGSVNIGLLLIQWVGVVIVGVGIIIAAKD